MSGKDKPAAVNADVTRKQLMSLVAESGLDVRTVTRALNEGVDALRAAASRERLREAAKKLKIKIV
jgi:hypothetical protein